MKRLILNLTTSEKRAAIMEGSKVKELLFDRPDSLVSVGSIYLGRVTRVISGMQAAFVDLGNSLNGFIHGKDLFTGEADESTIPPIAQLVTEGQSIIVEVKKEATQSKGPLLTKNITLRGSDIVFLPNGNYIAVSKKLDDSTRERLRETGRKLVDGQEGLIMRTSSKDVSVVDLQAEVTRLREEWTKLQKQADEVKRPTLLMSGNSIIERALQRVSDDELEIVVDDFDTYQSLKQKHESLLVNIHLYKGKENIFSHYRIDPVIKKLYEPYVRLKNGGHLIIEPTETMTVIDVNTGKFTGKIDREKTVLETNLLAAEEAAHQLRLRNISGMILIDFIRMKNHDDQNKVMQCLKEELSNDPIMTKVHGYTSLGLMEITRKKMQNNHLYMLTDKCLTCDGKGRNESVESAFYSLERQLYEMRHSEEEGIWINVSNRFQVFLQEDGAMRFEQLKRLSMAKLYVTEGKDFSSGDFTIKHIGSCADIERRINHRQ